MLSFAFWVAACAPVSTGVTLTAVSEHHGKLTWSFHMTDSQAHHIELDLVHPLDGIEVDIVGYTPIGVAVPLAHTRAFGSVIAAEWYLPALSELDVRMHVHLHPTPILANVCVTR